MVVDAAPDVVATTDATTTGAAMASLHLLITWPPKAVVMLAAPVPSPLRVVAPRDLSSQIWLNSITIGMFVILVVLMWRLATI
jgi:hypothetical protein